MTRFSRFLWLSLLLAFVLNLGRAPAAQASSATFTVTVKSAFLRSAPDLNAERVFSVFRNQIYPITGRVADNTWVQLNDLGWIAAGLGQISGDLSAAPILAAVPAPAATTAPESAPASTDTAPHTLKLTITVKSAFVRTAPSHTAARSGSVFKGQTYTAVGRNIDSQWVQIQFGNRLGWLNVGVGKLSGAISLLTSSDNVAPGALGAAAAPWIPAITPYMRQVYEGAPTFGRSLNIFAVVGDCNSESPIILQRFREGRYDFTGYEDLHATRDFFAPSYERDSLATYGGFTTAAVLNPDWGNPRWCEAAEGPFACELRASNASIVFISLGTGDQYTWRDSEANYRAMIEYALAHGVLPVLITKADALETLQGGAEPDYLNSVMRRLGQEYQTPVLDFWLASRDLSKYGLKADGFHLNSQGINLRLLTMMQTLNAIWRK